MFQAIYNHLYRSIYIVINKHGIQTFTIQYETGLFKLKCNVKHRS